MSEMFTEHLLSYLKEETSVPSGWVWAPDYEGDIATDELPHDEPMAGTAKVASWVNEEWGHQCGIWTSDSSEEGMFGIQMDTESGCYHAHRADTYSAAFEAASAMMYMMNHRDNSVNSVERKAEEKMQSLEDKIQFKEKKLKSRKERIDELKGHIRAITKAEDGTGKEVRKLQKKVDELQEMVIELESSLDDKWSEALRVDQNWRPPTRDELEQLREWFVVNFGYDDDEAMETVQDSRACVLSNYTTDSPSYAGRILVAFGGCPSTLLAFTFSEDTELEAGPEGLQVIEPEYFKD